MEDCNALVADCVAVSCCCQCLILQIVILVLLKLPCRLIRKLKEVISQKMNKHSKKGVKGVDMLSFRCHNSDGSTPRISMAFSDLGSCECCMHEVDMALEDLCKKGEFAFGSFWGRELGGGCLTAEQQDFDINLVQLEIVGIEEATSIHGRNGSSSRRLVIYV